MLSEYNDFNELPARLGMYNQISAIYAYVSECTEPCGHMADFLEDVWKLLA